MKKLLLLSILLIVGCANYQYISYDGYKYGYRDGQLSDDTFWAEYLAWDCWLGGSVKEKYTLLRSAELTKENGFKYFVVLEKKWGLLGTKKGHRFQIQCYTEKPTNINFNALDNYAIIYEADMVIKNYQYLYSNERAKMRAREE